MNITRDKYEYYNIILTYITTKTLKIYQIMLFIYL